MKLHELIALRKGEVGRSESRLNEIKKRLLKPSIYSGFAKTYEPIDEEGETLPPEFKRVQRNVDSELKDAQESILKLWNTVAAVELGNCEAKEDIVVNGETILEQVPVATLLFLEKQLFHVRTIIEAIPTLSPDYEWKRDENDGLHKTDVVKTHRNVKHTKVITLVQQDEHHAGQATTIEEPKLAGHWNTVQHSGALPEVRKTLLLGRVEDMLDGVQAARARANTSEAKEMNTKRIIDFIFA
jgi:hypothetical protein